MGLLYNKIKKSKRKSKPRYYKIYCGVDKEE